MNPSKLSNKEQTLMGAISYLRRVEEEVTSAHQSTIVILQNMQSPYGPPIIPQDPIPPVINVANTIVEELTTITTSLSTKITEIHTNIDTMLKIIG